MRTCGENERPDRTGADRACSGGISLEQSVFNKLENFAPSLKKQLVFSQLELLQFCLFREDQNHISGLQIRYLSTLPFL